MNETEVTQTIQSVAPNSTRFKRLGWVSLGVFCLLLFTLLKLPSVKIKNLVQGHLQSALSQQGIGLTVGDGKLGLGLGLSYSMQDVNVYFPASLEPVRFDEVTVKPALLSAVLGRLGATVQVKQKNSKLWTKVLTKGSWSSLAIESDGIDIGKIGILEFLANLKGSGVFSGEGNFEGDRSKAQTLNGSLAFDIKQFQLDPQSVYGFALPKMAVSTGKIEALLESGKLKIKSFKLGKPGTPSSGDDLNLELSGEVLIQPVLDQSSLNLLAKFKFSDTVTKAVPLIDTFLGGAKQPDGSFVYRLAGTVGQPEYKPGGQ